MASRVILELDDADEAVLGALGAKFGTTDPVVVLRQCLGGYAALLHQLDANPGSKLGLILIEIELCAKRSHVAPVVPLFPLEESDHEIEKFLNETDEPFIDDGLSYLPLPDPAVPVLVENCDGELQEVTQQKVDEALNNALESGYDYRHYDNYEELATDLGTYDADLEGAEIHQLVPLIKDWQARHR